MPIVPGSITQTQVAAEHIKAGQFVDRNGYVAHAAQDVYAVSLTSADAGATITCSPAGVAAVTWDTAQTISKGDWLTVDNHGRARLAMAGEQAVARALETACADTLSVVLAIAPAATGGGSRGVSRADLVIKGSAKDGVSVAAGARVNVEIPIVGENENYKIIAYKRVFVENATTNGANRDSIALQSVSTGSNSTKANIAVRNEGSAVARIKVSAECLCITRD